MSKANHDVVDYDVIIIGSGFGGSVSALRLAEMGLKVAILEQGRRATAYDLDLAGQNVNKLAWAPALKRYGFHTTHLRSNVKSLYYHNHTEIPRIEYNNLFLRRWNHSMLTLHHRK